MTDKKYTPDGFEVRVIGQLEDRSFVVEELYKSDYDEGPYPSGNIRVVLQVFDTPPTKAINDKICELKQVVEDLLVQKQRINKEIQEAERSNKDLFEKFSRYSALKNLEEFIDGKITHYLFANEWEVPNILTFKETFAPDQYNTAASKLLALFGNSDGNLAWKLNQYKDGSGSYTNVIPCVSYEQALEKAQELVNTRCADPKYYSDKYIKFAQKHGLKLPEGYIENYYQQERERLLKEHKATIDKAAELERKIKELT